ncbi:folate-binding protein YgfZ [Sporichthya sp.]|uniref:CAF17-like 4Fe-4S cluster assembly/insertion protein YgfZ n=1 Tax=Sporichthya sp. TaxID=65475 RepID=UPI00179B1AAD|nr:folate-binding protein YgfZ [Sporichthya sp.]
MYAVSSPLLSRPGAVPAEPPDEGVAAHYGDPYREQRALAEGRASVDLSHRPVIRVSGSDRLSWLHSLTTQHLTDLAPRTPVQALVLSPHGHIEHDLHLVDDGQTAWITVEPGTATDLVAFLDKMRFMLRVEVADVSAEWAGVWVPAGGADVPGKEHAWRHPRTAEELGEYAGREVLVPRARLADALGPVAGVWAHEALRIAAHVPRHGFETDHRTIPHELGLLAPAVHLNKGCYRGQETVARVHNLGRPPRRMVFLHLDGSMLDLPGHGAEITLEGRAVGYVGSAAWHYELGPIGLGIIKRNTANDATLLAGGVPAAVEVVVEA